MGKANATGRTHKKTDRFFPAHHSILASPAWLRLSANAKAAWLQIGLLYNGTNNGALAVSCRRLGHQLNISKDSAARAINDLVTCGFLEVTAASSFSRKRLATEYRLTQFKCDRTGESPSRAFQNLGKTAAAHSPCGEAHRRATGTP